MAESVRKPFELSASSLRFFSGRVEERHVAFAIDDDHRAVFAANQLDHVGHQAKRRFADAGATENVEMLEQEFNVNQDRVIVMKRSPDDDRVAFLGVSAFEKAFAVSVQAIPIMVLFIRVSTFECLVVRANGGPSDEVRRQGINAWKRDRLLRAGADLVIPDYLPHRKLLDLLFEPE